MCSLVALPSFTARAHHDDWHPDGQNDQRWFESPVYRDLFLRSATPAQFEIVRGEFSAGNWSVFGVWARGVMSGQIPTTLTEMQSPHAKFWSAFLARATVAERREWLEFLLRAQLAQRPIEERPNRAPVSGFTPACKRALLDYLAAFDEPRAASTPAELVGPRLIHNAYSPDERMIHLAGDFHLAEALPLLGRFLEARRRAFKLWTDYPTPTVETTQLFPESLRAAVKIGLSDPELKKKVVAMLKAIPAKPMEEVDVETYNAEERRGDSAPNRHVTPAQIRDEGGLRTKHAMIDLALRALESEIPERRALLEGRNDSDTQFTWLLPDDGGLAAIAGDRVFLVSGSTLQAIEVRTGKTFFRADVGQGNSNKGAACYEPQIAAATSGDLFLLCLIDELSGSGARWHQVFIIDKNTGEVSRSFKLAIEPERSSDLRFWLQRDDGVLFRYGAKMWRQAANGELLWRHDIEAGALVESEKETIAILAKDELQLHGVRAFEPLLTKPTADLAKLFDDPEQKQLRNALVLAEDRLFLFTNNRVLAFDFKGNPLWKKPAGVEKGNYYLNHPGMVGHTLFGDTTDNFYRVTPEGELTLIPQASIGDGFLLTARGAMFLGSNNAVQFLDFDTKKMRALPVKGSSTRLLGLTDEYVIVRYYGRDSYVGCIPRSAW
jgi:hypothetical protein